MVTSTRISDFTVNDLGGASVLALVLVATIIAMMYISEIHSTRSKEPDMAGISPNPPWHGHEEEPEDIKIKSYTGPVVFGINWWQRMCARHPDNQTSGR